MHPALCPWAPYAESADEHWGTVNIDVCSFAGYIKDPLTA